MADEKVILVDFLELYSKLLNFSSTYMEELGNLEKTDIQKFEEFKKLSQNPEALINLTNKSSPELSKIITEIIATFGSISNEKNPMDLTAEEKLAAFTKGVSSNWHNNKGALIRNKGSFAKTTDPSGMASISPVKRSVFK